MCFKTTCNIYSFISTIFSICNNKPKENQTKENHMKEHKKSNNTVNKNGFGGRVREHPYLRYQVYGEDRV